jgi:L-fucose isomerase-like protein
MKRKHHPRTTTVRFCADSPESIDESCITEEHAVEAATDGDAYWPRRVTNAFAKAGLTVHRLKREEHHPVWVIWLGVGSVELPADKEGAAKQIRKLLATGGLQIQRDELTVLERRGDRVKCVFLFGSQLSIKAVGPACHSART